MVELLAEPGITNLKQAIDRARAVEGAGEAAEVGQVLDNILKFLQRWHCAALRVNEEDINELFRALGDDRAIRSAGWLARRAGDWDTFLFWERALERFCRAAEAAEASEAAEIEAEEAGGEEGEVPSVASETEDEQLVAKTHTQRSYGWWSQGLRSMPR